MTATYIFDGVFYEMMLACAILIQEDDLSAMQHVQLLCNSDVYGKSLSKVAFFS